MSEIIDITSDSDDELQVQVSRTKNKKAVPVALQPSIPHASSAISFDWKIVLLMDLREFGSATGISDVVKDKVDKYFHGRSPVDRVYPLYCEKLHLVSADYMFVARKIDLATGRVLEERVLDLIIERKNINDLQQCLILPSKKYKPIGFFEAQMYKLQQCDIPNKLFLLEGDEDNPREFKNMGNPGETDKRLKRVKTLRLQIENGEYDGISIVCTRNQHDSVQYFIDQMIEMKERFDSNPFQFPTRTMASVKNHINERMKNATFQEYLRLRSLKGIGDAKAMKSIKDPDNSWDKLFVSPACVSKKSTRKSTLEDKATFYVSPKSNTQIRRRKNPSGTSGSNKSASASAPNRRRKTNPSSATKKQKPSNLTIRYPLDDNDIVGHVSSQPNAFTSPVHAVSDPSSYRDFLNDALDRCETNRNTNVKAKAKTNVKAKAKANVKTKNDSKKLPNPRKPNPKVQNRKVPSNKDKKKESTSTSASAHTNTSANNTSANNTSATIPTNRNIASHYPTPSPPASTSTSTSTTIRRPNGNGWTCQTCTFINANECFLVCEVCGEERA